MSYNIKKLAWVKYFRDFLRLCFISVKNVEVSIKETKDIKDIKVDQILEKTQIYKLF